MEIFEKLTKRRIKTFIEIQNSTKSNDFSFIRNKYLENEKYFEFVFDFLNGIGLFIRKNDEIVLVEKRLLIAYRNEEKLNSFLFEKTINDNSDFADYVLHYFQNFDSKNGSFVYKPLVKERLKESGLRNFLIDLDLVYHVRDKNCYAINENYCISYRENPCTWLHTIIIEYVDNSPTHLTTINICNKIYEKGLTCIDLITWIQNTDSLDDLLKAKAIVCFDNIRKEYRHEPMLLFYLLEFLYLRPNKDLKSITEL